MIEEYPLKGEIIKHTDILAHAPRGTKLPQDLQIFVAKPEYRDALIREALWSLHIPTDPWAKRFEEIPTQSFHRVQVAHVKNKLTGDPDVVVKSIHSGYGRESVVRYGPTYQYLADNDRHTAEFIGHITGLPESEPSEEQKKGKTQQQIKDLKLDLLLQGHPVGKIFMTYIKGSPLDSEEVFKFNEQRRHKLLSNLADHFAFFHGSGDTKELKSKNNTERQKPRYYMLIHDRKLGNFMYDQYNRVFVIDPESWEFTSSPRSREQRNQGLEKIIQHSRMVGLVKNYRDVLHFVEQYLKRAQMDNRKRFLRNTELAQKLWESAEKYREMVEKIKPN